MTITAAHADNDQHALVSSSGGSSSDQVPNFISDVISFTDMRETDIVDDDEASVSQSASRNDLRDADFRSHAAPSAAGDDETRRCLLRNFLDAKETDIVSETASDVALLRGHSQRSCAGTGSRKSAAVHSGPGAADDTEVKFHASNVPGRIKRQKTIGAWRDGVKAKKSSSQVQKSKSFSQADSAASRDRVRRIYNQNRRSVRHRKIADPSASDCNGGTGSRVTSQHTNSNRLSAKDAAKSTPLPARKEGRGATPKADDEGAADVGPRAKALAAPEVDRKRRKLLVRSHSTRQAKAAEEQQTLRRNVTVTPTDAGVGGLASSSTGGGGHLLRRVRRQRAVTPVLKLKCPAPPPAAARLTRQGSVGSGESTLGETAGSQDSFFTAHGDSVQQLLDLETTAAPSSVSRRRASDDDDDDVDNFSMSYNIQDRPNSLMLPANSYRWEKSVPGASSSTPYGSAGPIVFRVDEDDPEDDVVVGHVAEAKVSVPISICLVIIAAYIIAGSALFASWENWDYLTGSYFCFITLSTIGFGDVVPGTDMDQWSSHEKLVLCALWLAFGLSLLAMCFNLMQEEVKQKCRWIGCKLGLLKAEK